MLLTTKMLIFDLKMHRKMILPPPSASTWQICFVPIQLHSVKYSAIHHSQKKNSFPLGYQSFPISLHFSRDVVEHTHCTLTMPYVFQLQLNYKGISAFSDFTQDERNINSLAHEMPTKPDSCLEEKPLRRYAAGVTRYSSLFQMLPSLSYDGTVTNLCGLH